MITVTTKLRNLPFTVPSLHTKFEAMLKDLDYQGFDVSVILTTNATIRNYNREYRNKDKATDILSFPYYPDHIPGKRIKPTSNDEKNLGDIIISVERVAADAKKYGVTFQERFDIIIAHGIAHLLNYDHITDEEFAVMQKVEKKLLKVIAAL